MKRVTTGSTPMPQINYKKATSGKIYAYCIVGERGGICVLSTLGRDVREEHYGFVCINDTGRRETFVSSRLSDSIESAINRGRQVFEFDNTREFTIWMHSLYKK